MKKVKRGAGRVALAAACLAFSASAQAQTAGDDVSTRLLELMVQKGVVSQAEAEALLREVRRADDDVILTPHIPEAVQEQISEDVEERIAERAERERWGVPDALPAWLEKVDISGDVRVRTQIDDFADGNIPFFDINLVNDASEDGLDGFTEEDLLPLFNNTVNRTRGLVRARLKAEVDVTERVELGIRIVTNDGEPTSKQIALDEGFDDLEIAMDQAYVRLTPFSGRDSFQGDASLWFGKFESPFYTTELLLDRDLTFNGIALTTDVPIPGTELFGGAPMRVFAAGGAFPLEDSVFTQDDKWIYAGQAGLRFSPVERLSVQLAGAYYIFDNVQGLQNPADSRINDFTAPAFFQKGNTVFNIRNDESEPFNTLRFGLASEFEILAFTGAAAFDITDDLALTLGGEYARNEAFDETAFGFVGNPDTELDNQSSTGNEAWLAELTIGHKRFDKLFDWQILANYRRLEADAIYSAFSDGDFGLGGSNQEGLEVSASLGIARNVWFTGRILSAQSLDREEIFNGGQFDVNTVHVEINAEF